MGPRRKRRRIRRWKRAISLFLSVLLMWSMVLFANADGLHTDKTIISWQWDLAEDADTPLFINETGELVLDVSNEEEVPALEEIAEYLPEEIVAQIVEKAIDEPIEEPIEEPVEEPIEDPIEEPTEDPAEEPADTPTDEPMDEPTDEPTEEPTEEPTDGPAEEPTEELTDEPTENPVEEPTEEPTDEPVDEPIEEPTDEPADEPTEEPTLDSVAEQTLELAGLENDAAEEPTSYEERVKLTWNLSDLPEDLEGEYILTAALPAGYAMEEGTAMPVVILLAGGAEAQTESDLEGKYALVVIGEKGDKAAMLAKKLKDGRLDVQRVPLKLSGEEAEITVVDQDEKETLAVWEFEKISDDSGKYYVKGNEKYLKINGEDLSLEENEGNASPITIQEGTGELAGRIRLAAEDGNAPNLYTGQISANGFGGWNGNDVNEWFYAIPADRISLWEPVEGVSPNGTVIHLFDYWQEKEDSPDNATTDQDLEENKDPIHSGINENHALKFLKW